ncbi:MAG TPA: bifunctional riboflavin kinase/FAD synthetase [Actinomycetota bacterium]|nr:bifunctional riboflavin kinase/FAD synthetase [Actinomycetota bacterium]
MRALVGIEALTPPDGGAAVTIGTFDGVHVGHRALIARTREHAAALGAATVAVTWDRHPHEVVRPHLAPPLVSTPERKLELLADAGVDVAAVIPFTSDFARWPGERFATEVLARGLGARAVLVGEGWRFGQRARGDVALLAELGAERGFTVEAVPLAEVEGDAASSTRVRAAVAEGRMELAHALLGRPFDVDGLVVRGDARGTGLGYPTANVVPDPKLSRPPRGVYAGRARAGGRWYPTAVNVGVNPTFGGEEGTTPVKIEAYLLDFRGDLYGDTIRIEFWTRLRDELTFPSVDALVEQMARDVEQTRALTC